MRGHFAQTRMFLPSPSIAIVAKEKSRVKDPFAPLKLIFLPSMFDVYVIGNLDSFGYFWKPHKLHL